MGATTTMYISNPNEGKMGTKSGKGGTGKTTKHKKGKHHRKHNPEGLEAAGKTVGGILGSAAILAGTAFASTKVPNKAGRVALLAGVGILSAGAFAYFGMPGVAAFTGGSLVFGGVSAALAPSSDAARLAAAAAAPQMGGVQGQIDPRGARVQGAIRINRS